MRGGGGVGVAEVYVVHLGRVGKFSKESRYEGGWKVVIWSGVMVEVEDLIVRGCRG